MNIAFLTTLDPYDISNWSGTTNHLLQTLKKKHHVQVIGNDILPQVSFNVRNNFLKMKLY